jgi:hypothetical protein
MTTCWRKSLLRAQVEVRRPCAFNRLFNEGPGARLAAIAFAELSGNLSFSDIVIRAIGDPRSHFELFRALRAAQKLLYGLRKEHLEELRRVINRRSSQSGVCVSQDNSNLDVLSRNILLS